MKNTNKLLGLSAMFAVALAACSHPQGEPSGLPAAAPSSSAQASLTVEPGSVSTCHSDSRITAHVSWQVVGPSVHQVRVMVSDPGSSDAKLFSNGGDKGSADTGNWVAVGTRFDLLDAASGAKLNTYVVKPEDCKSR